MSGERPLRLAIVGTGRMGRVHLAAIAGSAAVSTVAVIDPVPAALEAALELAPGARGYATLAQATAAEQVDAVLAAVPSTLHGAIVAECAAGGLHILCEKPCGTAPAEALAAAETAQRAGIVLAVGYWRRYVPALRVLRQRIVAGELGELALVQCWQWDESPPSGAFRASSGGIAIDMGVHEFDQIRWLTGEELSAPVVLAADVWSAAPVAGDADSVAMLARLSGGGVAYVSLGRHLGEPDAVWLEVIGTRGRARVDVLAGVAGDAVFHAALRAQVEDFAQSVRRGGAGEGASAHDAYRALSFADASYPRERA